MTVDGEGLVCDEEDTQLCFRARPMFHDHALRKPEQVSRAIMARTSDQSPLQHMQAMGAEMGVARVDEAAG
jgi:hypothetical protein